MKKFALLLALSVPLALAMGCGTEPTNSTDDGPVGNTDSVTGDDVSLGTIESGLVVAMAPEGLTGDFYFNDDLVCEAAASCEVNVEGSITVELKRPERMFVPKTAAGSKSGKTTVTWTDADWGLAPNGEYRFEDDDYVRPAYTELVDGKIHLVWNGNQLGIVVGKTFSGFDGDSEYVDGLISDDLSTISYTEIITTTNKVFDTVLHRVD